MFNVGVIGARNRPAVKLTDREIGLFHQSLYRAVRFYSNGQLEVHNNDGGAYVPGEWLAVTRSNAYLDYQIKFSFLAIANIVESYDDAYLAANVWTRLTDAYGKGGSKYIWLESSTGDWDSTHGARLLVQIREISTGAVVASATYWTPGFAP